MVKKTLQNLRLDLMVKYLVAAVSGLLIDMTLYVILLKYTNIGYLWAGFYGFCSGFVVNYIVARVFVFTSGSKFSSKSELIAVLIVSVVGLGIHQISIYACVEFFHIDEIISKILAVGVNFFWNYAGRRYFVYHVDIKQ